MFGRKKPRVSCEHCGKQVRAMVVGNRLFPDDKSKTWLVNGVGRIACSLACADKVTQGVGSGKAEVLSSDELLHNPEELERVYRGLPFETEADKP